MEFDLRIKQSRNDDTLVKLFEPNRVFQSFKQKGRDFHNIDQRRASVGDLRYCELFEHNLLSVDQVLCFNKNKI